MRPGMADGGAEHHAIGILDDSIEKGDHVLGILDKLPVLPDLEDDPSNAGPADVDAEC